MYVTCAGGKSLTAAEHQDGRSFCYVPATGALCMVWYGMVWMDPLITKLHGDLGSRALFSFALTRTVYHHPEPNLLLMLTRCNCNTECKFPSTVRMPCFCCLIDARSISAAWPRQYSSLACLRPDRLISLHIHGGESNFLHLFISVRTGTTNMALHYRFPSPKDTRSH
jgi:hypothetical protein